MPEDWNSVPETPTVAVDQGRPWGALATIGWSALIAVGYFLAQVLGVMVSLILNGLPAEGEAIEFGGAELGFAVAASTPVLIGMTLFFAWLRGGIPLRDYLAWRWVSLKSAFLWCSAFILFLTVVSLALSPLDTGVSEEFMRKMLSGSPLPILLLVLLVAAPVSEEIFFRGFLFAGLKNSRLGDYGAIGLTSILFAAIHLQYDLHGLLIVVAAAIFFGAARAKANSLPLCMALHSLMNLVSTVFILFFEEA